MSHFSETQRRRKSLSTRSGPFIRLWRREKADGNPPRNPRFFEMFPELRMRRVPSGARLIRRVLAG